jgi:hypothetical protein
MPDILEYVREKLDWVSGRILELLTGLTEYRLGEVKARVPEARRVAGIRPDLRFPPSGHTCDRY